MLLAHATDGILGGDVTIAAENTSGWNIDALDWIREHLFPLIGTGQGVYVNSSDIILNDAKITGDEVSMTAKGGYVVDYILLEEISEALNGSAIGELVQSITGQSISDYQETLSELGIMQKGILPIPVGVNVRIGYAVIELNGASIIEAVQDLSLIATAIANGAITIKSGYFAFAVGVGVGTAKVLINGTSHLTSTAGNILIKSDCSNNTSIIAAARDYATENVLPIAIGIGVSVVTSKAIVAAGTILDAYGAINVIANGQNVGGSSALVMLFEGGEMATGIGIYVGISNVLAQLNGTATAAS